MSVTPISAIGIRKRLLPMSIEGNGERANQIRNPTDFRLSENSIIGFKNLLGELRDAKSNNSINGAERSLRTLRNKILGHEALKQYLMNEWGLVEKMKPFLEPKVPASLQREASVILGSLIHHPAIELDQIIRHQIPQGLLRLLQVSTDEKVKEAALRSLRSIYRHPDAPRDLPFQQAELLACLISYLQPSCATGIPKTAEYASIVLANCCDSPNKQQTLLQFGIVPMSLKLAQNPHAPSSTLEASLDLLAALTRDCPQSCGELMARTGQDAVSFLFALLERTLGGEIRIIAAICLCNLFRGGFLFQGGSGGTMILDSRVSRVLLPTLAALLQVPHLTMEASRVRSKASEVLALLVSDSEPLQMTAVETGVISKLARMLEAATSSSITNSLGSLLDEEKRAALLALAALSSFKEECRKSVIEAKILPIIVRALQSSVESIRAAACQCTRSLSRSVKNLRTALVDAGMIQPLMHLLSDSSTEVQKSACASLCNLVLDFSPMKEAVLREGGVERLVELTLAQDSELRLNSLWALKNLLYQSATLIKLGTLEKLGATRIEQLAEDPVPAVQEQTMNVLRNLVCEREEDVSEVLARFPLARLIRLLERKMSPLTTNDQSPLPLQEEIILHSCYVIANACTATDPAPKSAIMGSAIILDRLGTLLEVGTKADLQTAALWCVINLTWTEDPGSAERISALRKRGWERQLEMLLASHGIPVDVRDRAQTALNSFTAMHISPILTHSNNNHGNSGNNNNGSNSSGRSAGNRSSRTGNRHN